METEFTGLLTIIVFLPLVGALLIATLIKNTNAIRYFAGAVGLTELTLGMIVFFSYDTTKGGVQLVDKLPNWISVESFNVQYFLGVDGISTPLVLLTGVLGMVAIFASWGINERVREYFIWMLILQTSVMGVFTALDFLLFFILWEIELVPMFFLISMWGSGRREYSAMKFLIYTFLGSAFMLVGIIALFIMTGTFDMTELPQEIATAAPVIPIGIIFTLLFVAFAIKLPVFPFHTWLPDAHTDAPTAVSIILAGVLLKMGGYGMIRVSVAMFPSVIVEAAQLIAILGLVNVLYGAVITLRQTDLKRLVAFSSISHMGYVLIGISSIAGVAGSVSPMGLTGATMQMFTHGMITGLMFLAVGLLYDKAHTRSIPELGGLAGRMPILAVTFLIAGLASLGLPGTSGFISELLIFLGTFPVWTWITALSAFGIVITAGYILWMIQRTMFGPELERFNVIRDVSKAEMIPISVLILGIIGVGVYPALISDVFRGGINEIIANGNFTMIIESLHRSELLTLK